MSTSPPRQRLSADERRTQVVDAAIKRFATGGMTGTSTEDIAADVGLSQPYLFRLFRTKRDLFLACADECNRRIWQAFTEGDPGAGTPEERLDAMGKAYGDVVGDRDLLRFQLQMYAASSDEVVQARVRDGFKALATAVRERTGATDEDVWRFFATGMMINTLITLGVDELVGKDTWAAAMCDPATWG